MSTEAVGVSIGVLVTSGAEGTQVFANTVGGWLGGVLVSPVEDAFGAAAPAGTRVAGNRIGLAAGGGDDAFVPNRRLGLAVTAATNTVIGDAAVDGQGPNLIAGNGTEGSGLPPDNVGAPGVFLPHPEDALPGDPTGPAAFVTLRRNRIWGNQGLAVTRRLRSEGYGVTPNGPGNTDGAASFDTPVLLQAAAVDGGLRVVGTVGGQTAVEVFADRPCDATGFGEGRRYLGTVQSVDGAFEGVVDGAPFTDWRVSVTGTNSSGTTSEFGACVPVAPPGAALAVAVGSGETPTVDGPDLSVTVTSNPGVAARGAAVRVAPSRGAAAPRTAGTLYLARHDGAADGGPAAGAFDGTATGADGTTVTPNAVQQQRFWSVRRAGLDGITAEVCLRYDGLFSLPVPGQIVVVTRAGRGAAWTPHATTLREAAPASYACAAGLAEVGEAAIGADSTVNPVAGEPGAAPAVAPPAQLALAAWPNPARRTGTVSVAIPAAGAVSVAVVDLLGRRVAVLHDGPLGAGTHVLRLDAARLPAGVYVVRATAGGAVVSRRLTVVR